MSLIWPIPLPSKRVSTSFRIRRAFTVSKSTFRLVNTRSETWLKQSIRLKREITRSYDGISWMLPNIARLLGTSHTVRCKTGMFAKLCRLFKLLQKTTISCQSQSRKNTNSSETCTRVVVHVRCYPYAKCVCQPSLQLRLADSTSLSSLSFSHS